MSPLIEKKQTSVGVRTHFSSWGLLAGLDVRLDPQGELDTNNPLIDEAARDLNMSKQELLAKIDALKPGEKIEW